MKLILCPDCGNITSLIGGGKISKCVCGKHSGKYCEDNITAVVTNGAILVGIDNNSYRNALNGYFETLDWENRIDFYITGWIPNIPGEVIYKDTHEEVEEYKLPEEEFTTTSTIPTK